MALERRRTSISELVDQPRRKQPRVFAHPVIGAMRQVSAAGVRWGHIATNPAALAGENPTPPPRPIRAFTRAELDALETNLRRNP